MAPEDREALLSYARACIDRAVRRDGPMPDFPNPSPGLAAPGAAFVTIRSEGHLRGCIGHPRARTALWKSVREMAEAASTCDPRFLPLGVEESYEAEICVLSPLQPARSEEVTVGLHGLYVRNGDHTGLLLPHVAEEYGWGREEFLAQAFVKAGLPRSGDLDPQSEIFVFTCERIR